MSQYSGTWAPTARARPRRDADGDNEYEDEDEDEDEDERAEHRRHRAEGNGGDNGGDERGGGGGRRRGDDDATSGGGGDGTGAGGFSSSEAESPAALESRRRVLELLAAEPAGARALTATRVHALYREAPSGGHVAFPSSGYARSESAERATATHCENQALARRISHLTHLRVVMDLFSLLSPCSFSPLLGATETRHTGVRSTNRHARRPRVRTRRVREEVESSPTR